MNRIHQKMSWLGNLVEDLGVDFNKVQCRGSWDCLELDDDILSFTTKRQINSYLLCYSEGFNTGEDISVISYNDAPTNEVILNGLTSVSTDFKQMGEIAAQMILNKTPFKTKCDFRLIRRSTF